MKKLKIFLAGLTLMGLMGFSKLAFANPNPQKFENVDLIVIESNTPQNAITDSLNKLKEGLKKLLDKVLPPLSEEEKVAAYNDFSKQIESEAFMKKIVDFFVDEINKKNATPVYFDFVINVRGKEVKIKICLNSFAEQNPVCMEELKKIANLA